MLQAKYYQNFKGCTECLLIIGNQKDFFAAAAYFSNSENSLLLTSNVFKVIASGSLNADQLYITDHERSELINIFQNLAQSNDHGHYYFDLSAVPQVEVIVSCGEYSSLP